MPAVEMWQVRLTPDKRDDLIYITRNLRDWDAREIFATRWDNDPVALADDCLQTGSFCWIVGAAEPIAAIGAVPLWPGVWAMWCFGTDSFQQIGLPLTKFAKRVIFPSLVEGAKARRLQCHSIDGHADAHAWLEFLGGSREAAVPEYGRDGEDFWLYSWRRP